MKKNMEFIVVVSILLLTLVGVLIYKNTSLKPYDRNYFYMDTYINVKIYSKSKSKALKALDEVDKIYSEYHNLTDKYNSHGNGLYELNHGDNNIDSKLKNIITYGYSWYKKSNGLLNIAIGNVSDIWKKYIDKKDAVPTKEELKKANINIKDVDINSFTLSNGVTIDLGAIAKGYATEEVGKYLESVGLNMFIVNAGGNVLVGEKYHEAPYKIGIQDPTGAVSVSKVIKGENVAVVTSGGYNRGYTYNGVKYNHIISPKTLYPVNNMLSVTVIAKSSSLADALSTTLFLMDVDEGLEFIKDYDAEAIWYLEDEIIKTPGFNAYE